MAVTDEDGSAAVALLIVEAAHGAVELPNHRLVQNSIATVCPVRIPLVQQGPVKAESQLLDRPGRRIDLDFLDIGATALHLCRHDCAGPYRPIVRFAGCMLPMQYFCRHHVANRPRQLPRPHARDITTLR